MRHPAYPEYKESGVQWLGQVPGHWEVKRLKFAFPKLYSGVSVNSESSPADQESVGVMKTSCVYGNQFIPTENKRVVDEEIERVACSVTADSLIVSRMNTPELVGNCGYVEKDYPNLFLPDRLWIARFSKCQGLYGKYAWYFCISDGIGKLAGALATGTSGSMKNLSQDAFLNIDAIVPPIPEQTAIADFLNRETGRIDMLVAKKRRLITLLKEKRTVLISRTVTRGLPADTARDFGLEPHTRFKDSGVEWLGQVPDGWDVLPIKRIVSTPVTDGPHETPEILDDGVPFVSAEAINNGRINFDRIRGYISEDDHKRYSKKYKPEYGDIYMVKSGATTGRIAMVETNEEFNIWSPLAAIRCKSSIADRSYVYFYLQSREFQKAVELHWSFGTQQNIGMGVIQNLFVPIGETKEQAAIATYLARETAKLDRLAEKVEAAIARLQEYRTALITAAVTGKIDVREAVA